MPTFTYDDQTTKTLSPETRQRIVTHIHDLIEEWSLFTYGQDKRRDHLGASIIAADCARQVWYNFRWVKQEIFDGRMLRLFERGHQEEAKFIAVLRGIGFVIEPIDVATGEQHRIYGIMGHYGGSTDAKAVMPWFPELPILCEFKTHNTKSFTYLVEKKLALAKPQHYGQMCSYGKGLGLKYGLYCAINKNDDDYYFELVELNWKYGQSLENKAWDTITAKVPPSRISDQPSFWKCKFCTYNAICHEGEPVEINCRSCRNAEAREG